VYRRAELKELTKRHLITQGDHGTSGTLSQDEVCALLYVYMPSLLLSLSPSLPHMWDMSPSFLIPHSSFRCSLCHSPKEYVFAQVKIMSGVLDMANKEVRFTLNPKL
jgi:hypothetical protein